MKRHSGRRLIFWYLVRIFCKNAREAASGSFFQMHGNQNQCFFTSLHSKKPAIHNFLLYSRISYYFSNGIQFRIFIIKMTIYSLFTDVYKRQIFISTLYLSAFTFGGGYVIVSLMKKKFVDELHWIEEKEMLDLVAIAQSSPGEMCIRDSLRMHWKLQI